MHAHDAMDDRIALAKATSHSGQKSILKCLVKLKVYIAAHFNYFKVLCFRREVKLLIAPIGYHLIGNGCFDVYIKASLVAVVHMEYCGR